MNLTWDHPLPLAVVLLLGGGAAAVAALSYAATRRVCPAGVRRWLAAIRLAALALAVLCLLGPSSLGQDRREERPPIFILVDCSRSMAIKDGAGGRARTGIAADLLAQNRPLLDRLAEKYDVSVLGFGRTLAELPALGPEAVADETQLGSALAEILSRVRGRRLAPVLVLSDGVNTAGRDPLAVARGFAATRHPLALVGLGGEADAHVMDRRVRALAVSSTALLHSTLPVRAEFAFLGCAGQSVTARLTLDGKLVEERTIVVGADREQVRAEFAVRADEEGQHRVAVELDVDPREVDAGNNRQASFFFIGRTALKVLLLEGGPRWESKFLRRSVEGVEGLTLVVRQLAGKGAAAAAAAPELTDAAELARYHAVIVGDVPAAALGEAVMKALRTAVGEAGTGFLMAGGLTNFGPGKYAGTAVGELLPVRVAEDDPQRKGSFTLRRGAGAPADFLLSLAEGEAPSAEAWGRLPALDGAVGLGAPKPAAATLLEANDGAPVLVGQQFGRGRAAALAADSTWRWTLADEHGLEWHRRFWRQLVLWIARQDQRGQRDFWVALDRFQFAPGETVDAAAYLIGAGDRFVPGARVAGVLSGPQGERKLEFAARPDAYRAQAAPEVAGEYRIAAQVEPGEGKVVRDEVRFVVAGSDAELDDPLPDHELLRAMAEASGGLFLKPDGVAAFLQELARRDERNIVERRRVRPLWDNLVFLLAFAAVLTAEWCVRRARRLP